MTGEETNSNRKAKNILNIKSNHNSVKGKNTHTQNKFVQYELACIRKPYHLFLITLLLFI